MKIERLIGIVMLLLQRELVSSTEMAEMFEVSKRTIFRDIETLSLANIPIYSIPGQKGGIGIMPTYKVDKKLLTIEDLTAIVTSLNGFEQLLTSVEIKKTLTKMKNMLDPTAEETSNQISLDFSNLSSQKKLNTMVEQLHLAIKKQNYATLTYIDREGNSTRRKIEPYHLLFRNRSWYIQGYSTERDDFRTFKLSRIIELEIMEEHFSARPFEIKPLTAPGVRPTFQMHQVQLIIDKIAREQIIERFDHADIQIVDEDHFKAELTLPNHEAGYRLLLNLGTHVRLQNRDTFYDGFVTYLQEIQDQYQ